LGHRVLRARRVSRANRALLAPLDCRDRRAQLGHWDNPDSQD
jgi:hypothetical protein